MIWECVIQYLQALYQAKRDNLIVDYRVNYIDWESGKIDVSIIPVYLLDFKIDGFVIGGE